MANEFGAEVDVNRFGAEPGIVLTERDVVVGITGSAAAWLSELDGRAVAVGDVVPFSLREICREHRIGEHTVQDHLKAVFEKLGVSSRRELVAALLH